ncbi:MAG: cellulose synthase subunit BcsC-related outer membrane protein [Sphingomonas fennica]
MPLDYQLPVDAQLAPAAISRPAGDIAAAPPAAAAAARTAPPANAGPTVLPAAITAVEVPPAAPAPVAAPAVVPVQYSPAAPAYAQPGTPVPSFQAPAAQPGYAAPVYGGSPAYQAPAYAPPAYSAPPAYGQMPAYGQPQVYGQPQPYAPPPAASPYPAPAYPQPAYPQPSYPQPYPAPGYGAPYGGVYPSAPYAPQYPAPYAAPAAPGGLPYQGPLPPPETGAARPAAPRGPAPSTRPTRRERRAGRAAAPAAIVPQPAPAVPGGTAYAQPVAPQPPIAAAPITLPAVPGYGAPAYGAPPAAPAPALPYGLPGGAVSTGPARGGGMSYMGGDPELDRINAEIASLAADSGPGADGQLGYRFRDGEQGLGQLNEVTARVAVSTGLAGGRVELSAAPIYLDSGEPGPSGLTRFGTNPLRQAQGLAGNFVPALGQPGNVNDSGVAVRLGYQDDALSADVGTTPIGFSQTKFQGGARFAPKISQATQVRVFAERRPVTDSVLSYAGIDDPLTGIQWGQVMRTGGGGGVSIDAGRGTGFYADGNFFVYRGRNTRDNSSYEANLGGYVAAWQRDTERLTIGLNVNYQRFDNNQNFFSFGHGGYFSPQRFLSVGLPVRYVMVDGPLSIDVSATPGFQTFRQSGEAVFPTSDPLQAAILRLQQANTDVLARYSSTTRSGLALALQGTAWYRLSAGTSLGGELRFNTFGAYNEAQALIRVRQAIGSLE